MSNKLNENCGHPAAWILRLVYNGKVFTYCTGCMIERLGLDNLETYNNPFIMIEAEAKVVKPKKEKKEKE